MIITKEVAKKLGYDRMVENIDGIEYALMDKVQYTIWKDISYFPAVKIGIEIDAADNLIEAVWALPEINVGYPRRWANSRSTKWSDKYNTECPFVF